MEIGPYRLKDSNTLIMNDGSWNEFANLLFVDNPVGTGFSYVDTDSYVHELDEMADQFVVFLEKFFALFPEYEHDDVRLKTDGLLARAVRNGLLISRPDLLHRRILCRTAHPLHRKAHSRTKQAAGN